MVDRASHKVNVTQWPEEEPEVVDSASHKGLEGLEMSYPTSNRNHEQIIHCSRAQDFLILDTGILLSYFGSKGLRQRLGVDRVIILYVHYLKRCGV